MESSTPTQHTLNLNDLPTENQIQKHKILIIGSGITGLSLLSALNDLVARNPSELANLQIILYTKTNSLREYSCGISESLAEPASNESSAKKSGLGGGGGNYVGVPAHQNQAHDVLWKSGIQAAMELGIGGRLGKVGWPVVAMKSHLAATASTTSSTNISKEGSSDANSVILDWSAAGASSGLGNQDHDLLPPMIAVRHIDIIRALYTRIAGHPELVQGSSSKDFTFKPSNNSPSSPTFTAATPTIPFSGPHASSSSSMAADLAEGDWFTQQGFAELLPQIKFGHELESFVISAEYGTVYVKFTNGVREKAFMLLGADGSDSTVRSLLLNSHSPLQYTKQLVIKGTTSTLAPPISTPTHLPNSSLSITPLSRKEMLSFCRDGESNSWITELGTHRLGLVNMGNDRLGWTLVVPQDKPGDLADRFTLPLRRQQLAFGLGSGYIGTASGTQCIASPMVNSPVKGGHSKQESWQEWQVPPSEPESRSSVATDQQANILGGAVMEESLDSLEALPTSFHREPAGRSDSMYPNPRQSEFQNISAPHSSEHVGGGESASQTHTPSNIHQSQTSLGRMGPGNSLLANTSFGSSDLSGTEARDLALHLLSQASPSSLGALPSALFSIISQSDTSTTVAFDNCDLHGENLPTVSYTSPKFHPGRVMLVGDAAHAMAEGPHGSHASSLCLADAVVLSKLIGFYFSSKGARHVIETAGSSLASASEDQVEGGKTFDMHLLEQLSNRYSALRASVGSQAVTDQYKQTQWTPVAQETSSVWKSLTLMAGLRRETWALGGGGDSQFQAEMSRGKAEMPDGVAWPLLC